MELLIVDPDGNRRTVKTPATAERRGRRHHIVRVAAPQAGDWTALVRNHGSDGAVKYTLSGAVQSPLVLSAETPKVGADHLVLLARLVRGHKPWDDARVFAQLTLPTRSLKEILDEFGDQIKDVQLPEALRERGLTEAQLLQIKLSIFAQKFRGERGGLYGRETLEVEMTPQGDGMWVAELPLAVAGTVDVAILAEGKIDGRRWTRRAVSAVQAAAPVEPLPSRFTIKDIIVRRNRLWGYTIIGVPVVKANGAIATPADDIGVEVTLTMDNRRLQSPKLDFYRRGGYFIWRVKTGTFGRTKAHIAACVGRNGVILAKAEKTALV
jgi:hypothetical protein